MSVSRLGKRPTAATRAKLSRARRGRRPRLTVISFGVGADMHARLRDLADGDRVSALCLRLVTDGQQRMWDRRNQAGQLGRLDVSQWL